jgi:hypothetical protein
MLTRVAVCFAKDIIQVAILWLCCLDIGSENRQIWTNSGLCHQILKRVHEQYAVDWGGRRTHLEKTAVPTAEGTPKYRLIACRCLDTLQHSRVMVLRYSIYKLTRFRVEYTIGKNALRWKPAGRMRGIRESCSPDSCIRAREASGPRHVCRKCDPPFDCLWEIEKRVDKHILCSVLRNTVAWRP